MEKKSMPFIIVLSLIFSIIMYACGGGGGGGSDTNGSTNLSGNWSGTWVSTVDDYSGTVSASLTQSGNTLSGSATFPDSPCLTSGTVSGSVSDNNVAFGVLSGETTVNFSGTFTDSTMSGSYSIDSGACSGAKGTFSMTKEDNGGDPGTSECTLICSPGSVSSSCMTGSATCESFFSYNNLGQPTEVRTCEYTNGYEVTITFPPSGMPSAIDNKGNSC